jgi:[ribosomal protein S18]-alanine N-acetyltransferase
VAIGARRRDDHRRQDVGMTYDRDLFGTVPAPPAESGRAAAWTVVTPVRVRDLAKVARLQRRAFRPPLAYGLPTLLVLWALPKVQFLVARDGERIVGCAIGDREANQARVINICVDPTAQRQGIGAMLLRELEAALPAGNVVLMVEEGNKGAQALYRREGYLPVGTSRDYYGRGLDGIWMQKQRTPTEPPKIRM